VAVLDTELLEQLQRMLIEAPDSGATWPSGLWTRAEVLGYVNNRQDRFLKETLLITSWLAAAVVPGTSQQDLPDGWLATRNVFITEAGHTYPVSPVSRREADCMLPTWQSDFGRSLWYISEEWATRQISLVPAPLTGGVLNVFAALVGAAVDGTGLELTIPDECEPYLMYGVLADMFGKQGRAYDAPRASYCESRYVEGVQLAQALLKSVVIS
jgi:hypothetical protein